MALYTDAPFVPRQLPDDEHVHLVPGSTRGTLIFCREKFYSHNFHSLITHILHLTFIYQCNTLNIYIYT